MKATDLIGALSELVTTHGDLIVMNEYGHPIEPPEWNDDDDPPVILVSFDNIADSAFD